ncbi:MAG: glycoside hydrolase family 88 protein [Mediterranea sp.]|jgi:unsaturated chondroitin disaccharide hydrolase|nr:glycoside hydrolase family 88 protein [Mediterranea sp.]
MKTTSLILGAASGLLAACGMSVLSDADRVNEALDYCDHQVHRTLGELRALEGGQTLDYTLMPRNIARDDTAWNLSPATPDEWCAGFWPGILWYDYEHTGDTLVRREAERYTASLGYLASRPAFDHDLGFLIFCSYGNGYRLTGNPAYKKVVLDAADTLATLYRPKVGALLSWPRNVEMFGGHNVIMDNMMNLEMLMWAAKNGGNPYLADIAVAHADKTMRHQFRPDYTSYHVAVYDTLTGQFVRGVTHQGYADGSMWARGQAWGIYGFTMMYRETRDTRYLEFARKITDAYLVRLPDDYVPYWDFDDPAIPQSPRDASAACVVASALTELCGYTRGDESLRYRSAAQKMLASLASPTYRCGAGKSAFLLHSVGNMPAHSEIDASIIYADYYYIEALTRWKKLLESEGE